ncbi:MAG TPA: signal peptidase I [Acidimicrobiia bacterium]|nr:signal peptidase I [Acidimicrobiia bacterium]
MKTVDRLPGPVRPAPIRNRVISFAGWLFAALVGSTLLWIAVPALIWGWRPLVVVSGSMAPLIRPGDVVLVEEATAPLNPGSVLAFQVGEEIIVHRVVAVDPDGYLTRGDANRQPDGNLVPPDAVIGRGRLLVPFAGLPKLWGPWWTLAAVAAGAVLASRWRSSRRTLVTTLSAAMALTLIAGASAVFAAATSSSASAVAAGTVAAPSGLTATCGPVGSGNVEVDLAWAASPTPGLTGYEVLHDAPGGDATFTTVGNVPPDQTTFTHVVPVAVLGLGTHTYSVRASQHNWRSANSNTDAVSITQVLTAFVCTEL